MSATKKNLKSAKVARIGLKKESGAKWPPPLKEYPALCLVIPCRPATKKERNAAKPIYREPKTKDGGWYECPRCGMEFHRHKPAAMHMGLVMNIPESCTVAR